MGYATGNGAPDSRREQSRNPKRISVTLPYVPYKALEERSTHEGRSLSNLAASLIEEVLEQQAGQH